MSTYFVVGASRGIGTQLVKQLLENYEGSKVIAGVRNPTASKELLELHNKHKDRLTIIKIDISKDESVQTAADVVAKRCPEGIDYLINNGAVHDDPKSPDSSPASLLYTFNTNTVGPLRVFQAMLPSIRKGKKKVVINVTSVGGAFAMQDLMNIAGITFGQQALGYRTSKAALNLVSLALAKEYANDGIIIVPIHPGEVETDMMMGVIGGQMEEAKSISPGFALIPPSESARLQLQVYHKLKLEDSGKLINYKGEPLPW